MAGDTTRDEELELTTGMSGPAYDIFWDRVVCCFENALSGEGIHAGPGPRPVEVCQAAREAIAVALPEVTRG